MLPGVGDFAVIVERFINSVLTGYQRWANLLYFLAIAK